MFGTAVFVIGEDGKLLSALQFWWGSLESQHRIDGGVAGRQRAGYCLGLRFRSTRSGNRQLNKAIHRMAVTQLRQRGLGRKYCDKRIKQGDNAKHALRCLKRRLSRVVFNRLREDERSRLPWPQAA